MTSARLNNIFFNIVAIVICAASYMVLNNNIELSLLPHKIVLEYLYNYNFVFIENIGYEQTNGLFIIAQNCLGIKLFINLFLILVFGFLHKYSAMKDRVMAIIKFYFIALVLAFVITIMRISASVPFCTWDSFYSIHNVISLTIYFISGLALYFVMERKVADR